MDGGEGMYINKSVDVDQIQCARTSTGCDCASRVLTKGQAEPTQMSIECPRTYSHQESEYSIEKYFNHRLELYSSVAQIFQSEDCHVSQTKELES